jgi:hypothetical protein
MKTLPIAIVIALACAASVSAQYPQGYYGGVGGQPGMSPYLNLLNNNIPAVRYYGMVRPQFAFQNAIAGLQQQAQGFGQQADPTDPTLTRGTGHPVYFNNLSHYYHNDPSLPGGARFGATRGNANQMGGTFGAGANRGFGTGIPAANTGGMGFGNQPR